MTVQDYLRVLRRHWALVALALALGIIVSGVVIYLTTPQYQAQARMFVSTQSGQTNADLVQGGNFTQQRVQSYADVATSPRVLEPVIDELNLEDSASQLAKRVRAQAPAETVIITLSATDPDPEQAATIANAVSASLISTIADLERTGADGQSPVKASVVQQAVAPGSPVTPNIPRNLGLGAVLGLLLGLGAALLREALDTRVRTEEDIRALTDATVLGIVPFDKEAEETPLVAHADPHGLRSEALRSVRTNLQFVDATTHPKSIVITSSLPGEGKSSTAVNLAITMAEAGTQVCVVEADLRRPKAVGYLGLEGGAGLTTVLIGEAELDDVLQPWGGELAAGRLSVLATGPLPPNPSELLGSQRMQDLIAQLESEFDMVVFDAPPLLPVTDASVLARHCGGVILMVGSGRVDSKAVVASLENLAKVDARLLGVVVNRVPIRKHGGYYYQYQGYAYTSDAAKQSGERSGKGKRSSAQQSVPAPPAPFAATGPVVTVASPEGVVPEPRGPFRSKV